MSYCNCCEHFGVCKYQEEFEKFKEEHTEKETDVFRVEVMCKKYSSNIVNVAYSTTYASSTNPCESCNVYKEMKTGKIYVGDSPCQWCQHDGLKVTC